MSKLAPCAAYRDLGEEPGNSSTEQWTLSHRKGLLPRGISHDYIADLFQGLCSLGERKAGQENRLHFTYRSIHFDALNPSCGVIQASPIERTSRILLIQLPDRSALPAPTRQKVLLT